MSSIWSDNWLSSVYILYILIALKLFGGGRCGVWGRTFPPTPPPPPPPPVDKTLLIVGAAAGTASSWSNNNNDDDNLSFNIFKVPSSWGVLITAAMASFDFAKDADRL